MAFVHVPSSQLVIMPQGFAQATQPLVAATGALDSIATDVPHAKTVSYDDLDKAPRILGPLVETSVEQKGPPLTIEAIQDQDFYEGLEGSDFETQRAFIQGLLGRTPPDPQVLEKYEIACGVWERVMVFFNALVQHMTVEDRKTLSFKLSAMTVLSQFDNDLLRTQAATAMFLRGLALSRSEATDPKEVHVSLRLASVWFHRANLDGAAAISRVLSMDGNLGSSTSILDKFSIISYLGSSTMSGRNASPLGEDYLYALYYSKEAGDFNRMQKLLLYSGRVHEAQGMVEEAVRAYMASLWVFFQKEHVAVEMRDRAIAALKAAGRLAPQHESQFAELIEQLEGARVVGHREYVRRVIRAASVANYHEGAMDYVRAARAHAGGKPDIAELFEMSAHMYEKHDRLVEIARGEREDGKG